MKISIYYFSGTGNTAHIAQAFHNILQGEMRELKIPFPDITCFDSDEILGIGYPIHAFNSPEPVTRFVKSLPKTKGQKVFIFKTSGEALFLNHSSSRQIIHILKRKGYTVINEFHYVMPYNMIYRHSDAMAKYLYSIALQLVTLDAQKILKNRVEVPHFSFFEGWCVPLFRMEHPFARAHGSSFKVDPNKCISCQKCLDSCPMNNISIDNGKFIFHKQCCLCMRCSMDCPVGAVKPGLFNRKWKINPSYDLDSLLSNEKIQVPTEDYGSHFLKKSYRRYFQKAEKRILLKR